jgi:hypothetical protein
MSVAAMPGEGQAAPEAAPAETGTAPGAAPEGAPAGAGAAPDGPGAAPESSGAAPEDVPAGAGAASARTTDDWAVCCSGGGIRSAAYCLGALQSLDQIGLLSKVRWILGVSGGSYIAASRALVARKLSPGTRPHAYGPGTPEERNLRYNTRYIAPNGSTVLVGVLSMFLGSIGTLVIVLAPLYAAAHAWGWLLRGQDVLTPSGSRAMTAAVTDPSWWLWPVIAGGITRLAFFWWWATLEPGGRRPGGQLMWLNPDDHDRGADRARLVSWFALLTAGLALAMLAVPLVISWLDSSTGPLGTIAHFFGFGARPAWSWSTAAAVFTAVIAVAGNSRAGLAKWTASLTAASGQGTNGKGTNGKGTAKPSLLTQLAGRIRQVLMPWLASAVIVAGGVILALLWTSDGARAGFSGGQLLLVIAALVVMLLSRIAVNVNRLSLHDSYRWRLADAFAVTREAAEAAARPDQQVRARDLFADAAATRLSELPHEPEPEHGRPGLVICGTANINAVREVPAGQGGFCVTFDAEHVTLHREAGLAAPKRAQARTSDYEALVGHRRATLFDVSAISGAAVSPLMGSATRQAYRILFTAANVSLGVWLPHPNVVRDARKWIDDREDDKAADSWWVRHPLLLLLWYLSPHPLWDKDADGNARREARLWAHVLRLRLREDKKLSGSLWYRVMQPTLGLLRAEAAGRLSYRATWMYVTDGGHYDNLGLVEAVRRGASRIVVLDASGDKASTWSTLGSAFALARADAGVDIVLHPSTMRPPPGHDLAPGQVVHPWAHGYFSRQQEVKGLPRQGEIWVCKLGWWTGAPWDVCAYADGHPTYPTDSTLEQLYDATEFDAYQQLGAATVLDAAANCAPPLEWAPAPADSGRPGGLAAPAAGHGGPGGLAAPAAGNGGPGGSAIPADDGTTGPAGGRATETGRVPTSQHVRRTA